MSSSLAALLVLLTAVTEQPVAAPSTREPIVEITITGPESLREKMEEAIRTLVGDDPNVRWTSREVAPGGDRPAVMAEHRQRIWVDLAHPIAIHIDSPGCTSNARTVEHPGSGDASLVERETVAQIVKTALESMRGDATSAPAVCNSNREKEKSTPATVVRRRTRAVWVGIGGGVGWGYVPAGRLEWEHRIAVTSQAEMVGLFHLLPEVGFMWTDDFAIAVQARLEFIRQRDAIYYDPSTGEAVNISGYVSGSPHSTAHAGFLRAIWYHDLSGAGKLRLSISGDVGGGVVRFPVGPVATFINTPSGESGPDLSRCIVRTDTRPMGTFLFGGSIGGLWHLTRHFAVAVDSRVLSGLPDRGVVVEAQLSAQVGFGGAAAPVTVPDP